LFVLLFSRLLGPLRGALVAAIAIVIFTILVGADPAVVRAAIMDWVALLAWLVGRRQAGLNTLVFTAFLMADNGYAASNPPEWLEKPAAAGSAAQRGAERPGGAPG
jgi:hypothetical protein